MNGFLVVLAYPDKRIVRQIGIFLYYGTQNLACYVFNEAWISMRLIDDVEFVRALEQSIVLRTHSAFGDVDKVAGIQVRIGTNHQCSSSTLVVGSERRNAQHLFDDIFREALLL